MSAAQRARRESRDRSSAAREARAPLRCPRTLYATPRGCKVTSGGIVVMIRRAILTPAEAIEGCRAIAETARESGRSLVMLNVFRLSPEFPIEPGFDAHLRELASALRSIEPVIAASADVLELGGVRAVMMRAATRVVWAIARPRAAQASFERISDAIEWLLPHAREIGAADDAASYVRLYRHAQSLLDDLDAARAAAPR